MLSLPEQLLLTFSYFSCILNSREIKMQELTLVEPIKA